MPDTEFDKDFIDDYLHRLNEIRSKYASYLEDPAGKTLPNAVMGPDQVRIFDFLVYIPEHTRRVFEVLLATQETVAKIAGQERQSLQFADFLQEASILLDPKKNIDLRKDIRSARRSAYVAYRDALMSLPEYTGTRSKQIALCDDLLAWADPGARREIIDERDRLRNMEISTPVITLVGAGLAMILMLALSASRVFW